MTGYGFPHVAPTHIDEARRFMRGIGAGMSTTACETHDYPYDGEVHVFGRPHVTHFYLGQTAEHGVAASLLRQTPMEKAPESTRYGGIYTMLYIDLRHTLGLTYTHETPLREFKLLRDIALLLERNGYQRQHLAKAIIAHRMTRTAEVDQAQPETAERLFYWCDLAQRGDLDEQQRLACFQRRIPLHELDKFRSRGLPFSLICDLYPVR